MKSPSIEEIKRWHDEEDRYLSEKIRAGDIEDIRISNGKGIFAGRFDHLSKEDKIRLLERGHLISSIKSHPKHHYLTGITALNIVNPERPAALRQTNGVQNIDAWHVACHNIDSTQALLGMTGIREVTDTIHNEVSQINIDGPIYAASYERAVFDLAWHFIVCRGEPIPNLLGNDIDGDVSFDVVRKWIKRFEPQATEILESWIRAE